MIEAGVRRALRFWAVFDVGYALAVAALALWAVPWKAPAFNVAALVWALSLLVGAPGLWRAQRWAYRLGLIGSLVGLAAAALAVAGLLASWAYLRAAYGAFGAGASIASLLLVGMVWQVLGLYPALRLRALLRPELRRAMASTSRAPVAAALALAFLPLPVGLAVSARFGLPEPVAAVPEAALAPALRIARAHLAGTSPTANDGAALRDLPAGPGPLAVTLWSDGRVRARGTSSAPRLAEAIERAASLARDRLQGAPAQGLLKIDRGVARAPVTRHLGMLALGLDPGLDGIVAGDDWLLFLGDDVLADAVAGAGAPIGALDELRAGLDVDWLRARFAGATGSLSRVRSEAWMELPGGGVARVHRGNPTIPALAPRAAAELGGDYLIRQMESDGRFRYRYQPHADRYDGRGDYSLARHAGAAYGLSQLFSLSREPRFAEAAQAALAWLALQLPAQCGPRAERLCLMEGDRAAFGPSALAAIAMFEYQRRTGDARFAALAQALAAFLADRQRPDGEFEHGYAPGGDRVLPGGPRLFATEQAALALVLAHRVGGRAEALPAAERALDFLTGKKYDFPLGRFIYGADHWTCIAAEEAWPVLKHRQYLDFCTGYAAFMRRLQYAPTPTGAARDFAGHYGFGYQLVPQAPATAGFTEALLSTLVLARAHGAPTAELEDDVRGALGALAREQLRADNSYLVPQPARAAGGFRRSLVEPEIRIDFVQHSASALARGAELGFASLPPSWQR